MKQKLPRGWTEKKIRELIEYYDSQTEAESITEAEAAYNEPGYTMVQVPNEVLNEVEALISHSRKTRAVGQ